MLSTTEAFKKFKSKMELTKREQDDVSARHTAIRELMRKKVDIEHDFLTGSYKRWTKTKPLKDVDIFFVLGAAEKKYRARPPSELLEAFAVPLRQEYTASRVQVQRRSVSVSFGVPVKDDETDERVLSVDVVPAFVAGANYELPDTTSQTGWTKTNPKVHEQKAIDAHEAYSGEWKGLVRIMKYWNNNHDKPIKPSFLVEVMALEALPPPFKGDHAREMQAFFATLADRVHETWEDPAGLGPPVSDQMDPAKCDAARAALQEAERQAAQAIRLSLQGKQGDSLRAWRNLFGPLFPLS